MRKFTLGLTLGAVLLLGLAAPDVQADPIVQSLPITGLSADQFAAEFVPYTPALSSSFTLLNTPTAGDVESQVFRGIGPYSGLIAYAYQIDVNNVGDNAGAPTSVNSASMAFNSFPIPLNAGTGKVAQIFAVTDGPMGGIGGPMAAPGRQVQVPASVAWQPGTTTASLTFQYLDPTTNAGPLADGSRSATLVVMTNAFPGRPSYISIQNADPQTGYPLAYAPTNVVINQVPAPEPATMIGWMCVLAALALVRRRRTNPSWGCRDVA